MFVKKRDDLNTMFILVKALICERDVFQNWNLKFQENGVKGGEDIGIFKLQINLIALNFKGNKFYWNFHFTILKNFSKNNCE